MDRERLYEILDIEEPAGFDYFENIAALLECDENIGYEELYGFLQEVDKETLSMLIDNYFEELSDFLPEDDADFYLKIDQIRRSLVGLAKAVMTKMYWAALLKNLTGSADGMRQSPKSSAAIWKQAGRRSIR